MKIRFFQGSALLASLFALSLVSPRAAQGCASCGCTIASDWESQGYSIQPGLKMDIEYTFLDQNQLRSGTHQISPNDVPVGQELERSTRTKIINMNLDYIFNASWGVSVDVPWILRDHATLGETHTDYDTSSTDSIGDIKILGRFQGFNSSHNFGITAGLKLPTGSFWNTFSSGEILDRGLQPGTGTTDAIAGLYYFDTFGAHWGYFAEATLQAPLGSRSGYRPGTAETVNVGLRYTGIRRFIPQIQLNGRISGRDTGEHSDNFDSGGTVLNVAPGVTVEINEKLSTYLFVQVPLYQNLNGYQLAPTWSLTTGVRYAF